MRPPRDVAPYPIGASLPRQNMDRAHAPAAHHVAEPHARVLDLPLPRLTPQLQRRLPNLREPRRSPRVPTRDEPAVGRHRHPPAQREVAALDRRLRLPLAAEAEQLVVLELLDREGVVHLHEIHVRGAEAGMRRVAHMAKNAAGRIESSSHAGSVPRADSWIMAVILSKPSTMTTSCRPLSTAKHASRNAAEPVADAFSTR